MKWYDGYISECKSQCVTYWYRVLLPSIITDYEQSSLPSLILGMANRLQN